MSDPDEKRVTDERLQHLIEFAAVRVLVDFEGSPNGDEKLADIRRGLIELQRLRNQKQPEQGGEGEAMRIMRGLYGDQIEYVRLNNLPSIDGNHFIKQARELMEARGVPVPFASPPVSASPAKCGATTIILGNLHTCTREYPHAGENHSDGNAFWPVAPDAAQAVSQKAFRVGIAMPVQLVTRIAFPESNCAPPDTSLSDLEEIRKRDARMDQPGTQDFAAVAMIDRRTLLGIISEWERDLSSFREKWNAVATRNQELEAELAKAKASLAEEKLNGDAIDLIRQACNEIMGGNCAFVDDDFARCLHTMKKERDEAREELAKLRHDMERATPFDPVWLGMLYTAASEASPVYREVITRARLYIELINGSQQA